MSYKRLIPCIFIQKGKAVRWFNDPEVISEDVVELAKSFNNQGADEILVFDLSNTDEDHDESIDLLKKITRAVRIPVLAGGNIKRMEDVKKILYAGARCAMLNASKPSAIEMIEDVSKRFGKEKIAVSLNDFDTLYKHRKLISDYGCEIIFMHPADLNSVAETTTLPFTILTESTDHKDLMDVLTFEAAKGLSGKLVSQPDFDFYAFKNECRKHNISISHFESLMDFSEFKLNSDNLLPVIVQHYKTGEVLMMAYMNREAFEQTITTGKMTYYSRSRQTLWVKGSTSGHFQFVKSLTIDCDKDTLLAKVDQVGAACHTGNPTCFFQPVAGEDYDETNPLQVFESVYNTILDRKEHPKEGSYTNYLFDKGIDKILKKIGEEATEIVIAAKNPNPEEIKYEICDFLYHAMVLMVERNVTWEDITKELAER